MTTSIRFETLIERYHDEIFSYVWRLLDGNSADTTPDTQDVTQDVFMRAYQAFGRLRPNSNHRAWLYKIATNCAYTAMKRRNRRANHNLPLPDDDYRQPVDPARRPDEQVALNETLLTVQQAISELPAKQQSAVVLRHLQGLDYADIAAALGCSEDSARANVYQDLRRLRQSLGGQSEGRGSHE